MLLTVAIPSSASTNLVRKSPMKVCVGNGNANASPSRCISKIHSSFCGAFSRARIDAESAALARSFSSVAVQYRLADVRIELWYPRSASIHKGDPVSAMNGILSLRNAPYALSNVSRSSLGNTSETTLALFTLAMSSVNFVCAV